MPASTSFRLSMTRRVCASMPSGNGAPSSAGSVGIWPVTNSQPSDAVAWLKGATGVGAPATIRNSIMAVYSRLPVASTVAGRRGCPAQGRARGFLGDRSGGLAAAALDDLPQRFDADAVTEIAKTFLADTRGGPQCEERVE